MEKNTTSQSRSRTALITGASRGIGRAIALGLARSGFDVILNDLERQREQLTGVAAEATALGSKAFVCYGDVSKKTDVEAFVAAGLAAFPAIDAVVNNAGILSEATVDDLTEQQWDAVFDVNAKGTFLVVQALLPHMKAREYGRIVNISSIGGKHGGPRQAHYAATKAAVMAFTRVLAQEVGPIGITANSICPGIIDTDMGRANLTDAANVAMWSGRTALRRLGRPEDVVGAAVFFASDASAFVTGQSLNVDGGIVLS
ncbi:MAG: SDR family oxidoreductase [Candidatus Eremiobacteraeota bacterium]|nr:SDR family oxidoreductase [Candidatus Eremiobacteraeota bacterium]